MSLTTPTKTVQKLQTVLHVKAKSEPNYRFYSLWDKMYRWDIMFEAWKRVKANRGAAGIDGETFEMIEAKGVKNYLGKLQQELKEKKYTPQPLLRVQIPKANGGMRPLSIPTIKDRLAQMCWYLITMPIFEADLLPMQYGFRPELDAKMGIRRAYWHITQHGRSEIVDGDLKDYFNTIPHKPLLKCVLRRITDKAMIKVVKLWLCSPTARKGRRGKMVFQAEARRFRKGTGQGSIVSPLLANLYFRRFLLAWIKFGYASKYNAAVVNYADDFVICCDPGKGKEAMEEMRRIMDHLNLTVNDDKTRIVKLPEESFDFLGYRFCQRYRKDGSAYIGTNPSPKALKRLIRKIHDETSIRWVSLPIESRIGKLNPLIRGWANYFNQGPVLKTYETIQRYTERRLQRLLAKKHKLKGKGYRQFSEGYLYDNLTLFKLPQTLTDMARAKT